MKFREHLAQARSLPFPLVLWSVQNRCYDVLQTIHDKSHSRWREQLLELARVLSLRVE
jgi:hypothetical protein